MGDDYIMRSELKLLKYANQEIEKAEKLDKNGKHQSALNKYTRAVLIFIQINKYSKDSNTISLNKEKIEIYLKRIKELKLILGIEDVSKKQLTQCPACGYEFNHTLIKPLEEGKDIICEKCGTQIKEL